MANFIYGLVIGATLAVLFMAIMFVARDEKENRLEKQTKADVVEVKHGHWIYEKTYYTADECNCSLCGQLMTTAHNVRMNYCPKCGAKMDEEKSYE